MVLLAFVALNIFSVINGYLWVPALPVALLFGAFALLRPVAFWFFLVFITPFSIIQHIAPLNSSLSLPNEPFIALMTVLLVFKYLLEGSLRSKVLTHPLTIIIALQILWMVISSITSSMPLVSFKYLLSRIWYVAVFFFFAMHIFKRFRNIEKYIWYASISLSLIIVYTLIRHAGENFSHQYSYYASLPFFKDHNIYAVVIGIFVPALYIYALKSKELQLGYLKTFGYYLMAGLFTVGIILSYTRAAWVSLGAAFVLWVFMLLKVKLHTLLGMATLIVSLIVFNWTAITLYMTKNTAESNSDLDQHVRSIYNVTTDDSNTERLNRWSSAVRMFQERPIVGWGPNTYQFKYGPFQISWQKTKISTNQGDLGNAHSEFIGPLAEMGLLGMLLVIAMVIVALHKSMEMYYQYRDPMLRYTALLLCLGLVTYYVHGLLNNYLDVDKANVALWPCFAAIVALDVYHKPQPLPDSDDEAS